ncbi:MAG TPA: helical backbone metal receptor [Planctomycetota bacterium]|nr:helical backbone metal receptor [Planctomycetota bacterium]
MNAHTKIWTDAGGMRHDPQEAPKRQRVVSLVPSLTETLCAVGGQPRLVGCTAFCIHPPGLLKNPAITVVGGTKTVLRDKLLALKPDLLLLNLEENTLEDIDYFKSRVECYVNGVKTVQHGINTIRELGSLIGTDSFAEPLARRAEETLAAVRAQVAALNTAPPKLFYAIWREPWMTINADTFIHDHLKICGAQPLFGEKASRYPEVTLEELEAAAPEIVWLPSEPYVFKQKHVEEIRKLSSLPASQNGRIELVNGDNVCWFGVRQIEGLAYTFASLWKTEGLNEHTGRH